MKCYQSGDLTEKIYFSFVQRKNTTIALDESVKKIKNSNVIGIFNNKVIQKKNRKF